MESMLDPVSLLAIAEAAVDEVETLFRQGLGAKPAHFKGKGDFATEVDVSIEARIRTLLVHMTGIPVVGEESAGEVPSPGQDLIWLVDPIDGTVNFSAGSPMCGTLIALIHQGAPVVAVANFPLLGQRMSAATGTGLRSYSQEKTFRPRGLVGLSSHLNSQLLLKLSAGQFRPRMTGSVGLDSAFAAQGIFDGSLNFSRYPWDNAAGALLAQAAGKKVSDVDGNQWTLGSRGLVVGTDKVYDQLMEAINAINAADKK